MSYSFSRDRTAELRGSATAPSDASNNYNNSRFNDYSEDEFGASRRTHGTRPYRQNNNINESHEMTSIPMNSADEDVDYYDRRRNLSSGPATIVPMEEENTQVNDLSTTAGFFQEIDTIKIGLNSINTNVDQIGNLHNAALETFNEQQSKQVARDLERMKKETQNINNGLKQRIRQLETFNSQLPNDSETQMRRSQTAAIKKRFMDTIQRYQDVERNYQLKYRQRIERQIRIVKPEATEDEIDDIIDADDTPQIFAQSLVSASRQGQSKAVLSEVQKRHDDIRHIEKTIIELHQLFMDMQMMVEQQGEVLNTVEQNADETVMNVKEGNTNISKAITLAKATRAKKWCCFFICIAICVMIAILVWWFGFGHPGVGGGGGNNNNNSNNNNAYTPAPSPTQAEATPAATSAAAALAATSSVAALAEATPQPVDSPTAAPQQSAPEPGMAPLAEEEVAEPAGVDQPANEGAEEA